MARLFEIEDLKCGYANQVVLHIQQLDIPSGMLTFVVGPSGIGKSTLLETLGLMSNTVMEKPGKFSINLRNSQSFDLSDFWELDSSAQSDFRRNHFSFVFQTTNLLPNLSIRENLCVPLLIQGKSMEEASELSVPVARTLQLPDSLLDRPITSASGGQLQRISFARALSAEFSVLLGDEPTGNLDPKNAEILIQSLKNSLQEENRSAIIVSHDMGLANKYADCLISIRPEERDNRFMGIIDKDCVRINVKG